MMLMGHRIPNNRHNLRCLFISLTTSSLFTAGECLFQPVRMMGARHNPLHSRQYQHTYQHPISCAYPFISNRQPAAADNRDKFHPIRRITSLSSSGSDETIAPSDINTAEIIQPKTLPANTTSVSTSILSIDPNDISIVVPTEDVADSNGPFVQMFRDSADYIAKHRGTTITYHIPGELLDEPYLSKTLPDLMDDIALTWLVGMKIVIVAGCRIQIDQRLDELNKENGMSPLSTETSSDTDPNHIDTNGKRQASSPSSSFNWLRITDKETLRIAKEEAGFARFEIERQLARALRTHQSGNDKSASKGGNVISGNFYAAQPFGVIDGTDYQYTGIMRRVEVEKINQIHDMNDIVLLTSLGFSPSGEIFNVNSECLAAGVAGAMKANKIIYFIDKATQFRNEGCNGKLVQSLRLTDAKNLLNKHKIRIHRRGYAYLEEGEEAKQNMSKPVVDTLLKLGWSIAALENGVRRAHIIAPENGALLQELYTRDGAGTLISRDLYEGIRRANVNDVAGIYDLVNPLVEMGTLIERPKNNMEEDILSYYVYTRDNLIIACGQLKRYEGGFAEIGCLVVSSTYRSQGRGDAMLGFLERLCIQSGVNTVFVLSTQTMHWFVERGFKQVDVASLPPSRRATYNYVRKSKIYIKTIDDRAVDADELYWDR